MKILTQNLWHGLSPQGMIRFKELEPPGRAVARFQKFLELLEAHSPDVLFTQETSPLSSCSRRISEQLGFERATQLDSFGLKIFGFGLPLNLETGLASFFSKNWKFKKSKGLRLSGSAVFQPRPLFSLQLKECRFALFSFLTHPSGARILLVNAHLHHGPEVDEEFWSEVELLFPNATEPMKEQLARYLEQGTRRRLREVDRLLGAIHFEKKHFDVCILGGDLNASPDSMTLKKIKEFGFRDFHEDATECTFDAESNPKNHQFLKLFRSSLPGRPPEWMDRRDRAYLEQFLKRWEARPRRIDYLMGFSSEKSFQVQSAQVLKGGEMPVSDHYGLSAEIQID